MNFITAIIPSELLALIANNTIIGIILILLALAIIAIVFLSFNNFRLRRRLKKEAIRTQKAEEIKSSFLTHISLALRFPLNAINTYCHSLEDGGEKKLTPEERNALIGHIHKKSYQMYTYLNELQELTNFEGAVPALSVIEVNLAELIMSYRREILHETHRGVMVGLQTTMSPHCKVTIDTTLFRQLVMHLLRVAAQRTLEGTIYIRYNWENEGLRFWINDNGGKIPEELEAILFNKQLREEDIIHLEDKASYVSLNISKTIVDSMHGTIEAMNGEDDKGAIVTFWIPCPVKFS
ncbi:MAG: HAMP domain-containing histidine kinase [Bacteroidaceae bacterium]|nr:HAMP domain-containing histidine kinase [Bacteroidaceae bacterium]